MMSSRAKKMLLMAQEMYRSSEEASTSLNQTSLDLPEFDFGVHVPRRVLQEDVENESSKENTYHELQVAGVPDANIPLSELEMNDVRDPRIPAAGNFQESNESIPDITSVPQEKNSDRILVVPIADNLVLNREPKIDNSSVEKHSRWKKSDPSSWARNIEREKRCEGQAYKSTRGKIQRPKLPKAIDCTKCTYECNRKILQEERNRICRQYWKLPYERQRDFILSNVTTSKPKEHRPRKENPKFRENSRKYGFFVNDKIVRVCQKFFCKTLCISNTSVIHAFSGRGENGNFCRTDQRGKTTPANKTRTEDREAVIKHINSFPTVPSHYTRKSSHRQYLNSNLSISKMHSLYKEECLSSGLTPVSLITYRRIFCNNFNLSFFKPKKDQCMTCTVYEKANAMEKLELQDNYDLHMARKNDSMTAKSLDKDRAIRDPSFVTVTFDLQSVLQIPSSSVSLLYYLRKLNLYNLTIYNSAPPNDGYCYFWTEVNGKRGSCEIGTCIAYYLQNLPPHATEVSLFSDTCGGQNRNVQMSALMLHLVQKLPVQIIEHKFLESGHTFMEVDSMHSAIERRKRNIDVFSVHEWINIFKQARKSKEPYSTKEFLYSDFLDLKYLSNQTVKNRNIDENGETVNWLKIKCLRYRKDLPGVIEYRYDYTTIYKKIIVMETRGTRKAKRPDMKIDEIPYLYTKPLPISTAKKNDLLSLCAKRIVPSELHAWYRGLPAGNVPNMTAEPGVLDSDSEVES